MPKLRRNTKSTRPYTAAVIAAGGSSTRMGENKLLIELDGIPVLVHTLIAFENSRFIDEIILVAKGGMIVEYTKLINDFGICKVSKVLNGGASRLESVIIGVEAAGERAQFMAVHDAARPCIAVADIDSVCSAAYEKTCAVAVCKITDTVKEVSDGYTARTLDRRSLFAAMTPQVCERTLLYSALHSAMKSGADATDESSALELIGAKPFAVECSKTNIKLTTVDDVMIAAAYLSGNGVRSHY